VVFVPQLPEDTEAEFVINNNPFAQAPENSVAVAKGDGSIDFFLKKKNVWIVPRSNAKKCSLAKSTVENERPRTGGKDENLLNCTGLFGAGVA
jgi:hypothetical protein